MFLADFAFLGEFRGISRKYLNYAGPRPREISEALTIFYKTDRDRVDAEIVHF